MIVLRILVRVQETRLWKEAGGTVGTYSSPGQAGRQIEDYTKFGSSPGGDRPIFTVCHKILRISYGSLITAITLIGEWQ
jgi:hypothetical protein